MESETFVPQNTARTWLIYCCILCGLGVVFFGRVADLPLDVDDDSYLLDSRATSADFAYFWSPDKKLPGRPPVELLLWLGYELWDEDSRFYHALAVAIHLLASFLLAYVATRAGLDSRASLLGGLLFFVNIAHFRAVYWLSAIAYPLALVWVLLALWSLLVYHQRRRIPWLLACHAALLLGVLTHAAAAPGWIVCLYLHLRAGHRPWALLPLAALCGLSLWGLALYYPQTPQFNQHADGFDFLDANQVFLWLVARLVTTAHWLPFPLYEIHAWELALAGLVAVGWGVVAWRGSHAAALWGGWTLLFVLPFLSRHSDFFVGMATGPSRYLYLASAGTSMALAHLLLLAHARWGRLPVLAGLGALGASSWLALDKAEASSFYIAGHYAYFNSGFGDDPAQVERGIDCLQFAVAGHEHVVPLDEAHFALAALHIERGDDPLPDLGRGLARLPADGRLALIEHIYSGNDLNALPAAAAELRRSDPNTFFQTLATLYHRRGKERMAAHAYGDAIGALQQALSFWDQAGAHDAKTRFHALFHLGAAHSLQGQHRKALAYYAQALRLRPDHAAARYNLALAHRELGEIEATRQQTDRLRQNDPRLARTLETLLTR